MTDCQRTTANLQQDSLGPIERKEGKERRKTFSGNNSNNKTKSVKLICIEHQFQKFKSPYNQGVSKDIPVGTPHLNTLKHVATTLSPKRKTQQEENKNEILTLSTFSFACANPVQRMYIRTLGHRSINSVIKSRRSWKSTLPERMHFRRKTRPSVHSS